MSSAIQFDDAASRRIEQTYSTPDLIEQRRFVRRALALRPGEDVLDIGAGPGLLACEMAGEVTASGSVHGIDPSESMLTLARQRARGSAAEAPQFRPGNACELPFADASFDAVTSTQVYEYVEDMPGALAEVHRVLRPGGRLLVLDTDWDSIVWHASDRALMDRMLCAWEAHLVDPRLPRRLARLLNDAGLHVSQRATFPIFNAGYDAFTFSAGLIDMVAAFVPGRDGLSAADVAAWVSDLSGLGSDYFFSLNRFLFLARR